MPTRIVQFHEVGGPEVLQVATVDLPAPGPGEVTVRVEAIGLNRADLMYRSGHYLEQPASFPARLGYEASGVVERVGSDVGGLNVGDRVSVIPNFSLNQYGTYGELINLPQQAIAPRPDHVDAITGAAVWMQYLTAYGSLIEVADLRPGDHVLITAASSSVGLAAIQVANRIGAIPIAATTRARKKQALLDAGAAHVVVTSEEDVTARARELSGGAGVRVVLDPIAGPGLKALAAAVRPGGLVIVYGMLSGEATPLVTMELGLAPVAVRTYWVLELTLDMPALERAKHYILSGLRSGAFTPAIDRTFDIDEVAKAHEYLESNEQVGKVVLTIG